jgi:multisubunit Na+/H+ antiporter MnhG subunit
MLDAALSTVLSSGFLGAASYIAVATAIVNPVALTAIGVAGNAAGVYLQIKQIKGAR